MKIEQTHATNIGGKRSRYLLRKSINLYKKAGLPSVVFKPCPGSKRDYTFFFSYIYLALSHVLLSTPQIFVASILGM